MSVQYWPIYSKCLNLANNRVNLVTTRRFAEGAKIGAMAKFIQQEHSPAQVLAEFEQQVVAAG